MNFFPYQTLKCVFCVCSTTSRPELFFFNFYKIICLDMLIVDCHRPQGNWCFKKVLKKCPSKPIKGQFHSLKTYQITPDERSVGLLTQWFFFTLTKMYYGPFGIKKVQKLLKILGSLNLKFEIFINFNVFFKLMLIKRCCRNVKNQQNC